MFLTFFFFNTVFNYYYKKKLVYMTARVLEYPLGRMLNNKQ